MAGIFRAGAGAVVMVAALAVAGGCGSSGPKAAPPTTTSSTTASTTATSAPGASAPATSPPATQTPATTAAPASSVPATTTSTTAPGPQPCTTTQLAASLGAGNGAAGHTYFPLILRNVGVTTCITGGYPGVSYVTGDAGTQVGQPASRVPGTSGALAVTPGQTVISQLSEVDAANYPPAVCVITATRGLRVYPPNDTRALFVPQTGMGCASAAVNTLQVGPLALVAANGAAA